MSKIRLFWWNEIKLMKKPKENYGDVMGAYLVKKISKKDVVWINPNKRYFKNLWQPIYATIGSILGQVNKNCIVWGSGVIQDNQIVKEAKFIAVRGPETRRVLINQGYEVPEVYGDPALFMPNYYNPKIEKKYTLGIIPHYVDYKSVKDRFNHLKDVVVIDLMTNDVEKTTNEILACRHIVSSSLHGIIVPHAYQIPTLWIKFSDKLFGDDIKFKDYFKSVSIEPYSPLSIEVINDTENLEELFNKKTSLPDKIKVEALKKGLMSVCPFK